MGMGIDYHFSRRKGPARLRVFLILSCLLLTSLTACGGSTPGLSQEESQSQTLPPPTTHPLTSQSPVTESPPTESQAPPLPQAQPLFPDRYPIAFMVNNTAAARPQSGLDKAKLIYQMMTEARTTRFLLLTDEAEGVIGPIRSARPAFLDLVAQHQAFYAYAGNYRVIEPSPVVDDIRILDALKGDYDIYYRTDHRVAPHNLYTTLEKAYKRAETRYQTIESEEPVQGLKAYDDFHLPEGGQVNQSVHYHYSQLEEAFIYQTDIQAYYKYNGDQLLVDEVSGDPLEVANLILLYRPHSLMDNGVHIKINWVDKDQAVYLTGGKRYDITWEKTSHTGPMVFYLDDQELILNPGLTWILVLDDQALKTVEYD